MRRMATETAVKYKKMQRKDDGFTDIQVDIFTSRNVSIEHRHRFDPHIYAGHKIDLCHLDVTLTLSLN